MRRAVLRPVDPHQRAWRIVAIGLAAVWGTVVVLDVLPRPGGGGREDRAVQGAVPDGPDVAVDGAQEADGGAVPTTVPVTAPGIAARAPSPVAPPRTSPARPSPTPDPGPPAAPPLGTAPAAQRPSASVAAPSTAAPPTTAARTQPVTPAPVSEELPEATPVEPPLVTLPVPDDDAVDLEGQEPEDEPEPEHDDGRPGRGLGRGRGRGSDEPATGSGGRRPG